MTEEAGSPLTLSLPTPTLPLPRQRRKSLLHTLTHSLALYAVTPAPTSTLKGSVSVSQMAQCSS